MTNIHTQSMTRDDRAITQPAASAVGRGRSGRELTRLRQGLLGVLATLSMLTPLVGHAHTPIPTPPPVAPVIAPPAPSTAPSGNSTWTGAAQMAGGHSQRIALAALDTPLPHPSAALLATTLATPRPADYWPIGDHDDHGGEDGDASGQWCQLPESDPGHNGTSGWDDHDGNDHDGNGRDGNGQDWNDHGSWRQGGPSQPRTWRIRVGPIDLQVALQCRPDHSSDGSDRDGPGRWECHAPTHHSGYGFGDGARPGASYGYRSGYGAGVEPGYDYPGGYPSSGGGAGAGWDRYGWNPYASDFGWNAYSPNRYGPRGSAPDGYGPGGFSPGGFGQAGWGGASAWAGGAQLDWVAAPVGADGGPGGCWLVRPRGDHSSLSLLGPGQ